MAAQRTLPRAGRTSILGPLSTCAGWHGDAPPTGASGSYALDMRLADAFRMLVYLNEPSARLRWIEREVSDPGGRHTGDPYRAALIGWWMAIFEGQTA